MQKEDILAILKQNNDFVSGQSICETLHVSRTAVWKVMARLKKEGYDIEAVRNKGYRLTDHTDVINQYELGQALADVSFISEVRYLDSIDSTNKLAKQLAEDGATEGTLIVADEQTLGKGRRGRSWVSPKGTGIWMSLVLRPDISAEHASMITLIVAMSVADGIEEVTGLKSGIKWPNDVVVSGKKVCGILTEMVADMDGIRYIIPGIGINVNITSWPDEIKDTATSLYLELGQVCKRADIIAAVMRAFSSYYKKFCLADGLGDLKQLYEKRLVNVGRMVKVLAPDHEYEAEALGIDDSGELLVKTNDGEVRTVRSGEVSVRGIYGYI